MSVDFTLLARVNLATFLDTSYVGDKTRYSIDLTPWTEDNGAAVTAVGSIDYGSASISNETLVNNVWSADVTMLARGNIQILVTVTTASAVKVCRLQIKVQDSQCGDDYGQGCC